MDDHSSNLADSISGGTIPYDSHITPPGLRSMPDRHVNKYIGIIISNLVCLIPIRNIAGLKMGVFMGEIVISHRWLLRISKRTLSYVERRSSGTYKQEPELYPSESGSVN